MELHYYQGQVEQLAADCDTRHELVPMLGIGAHVGRLLLAHQRKLSESVIAEESRVVLCRELGLVLRWSALLATMHGLSLEGIARRNLVKVDKRAESLCRGRIIDFPSSTVPLSMDAYQDAASQTDQEIDTGVDPMGLTVPMLGLAGEVGSLLVETKKQFRGDGNVSGWPNFIEVELGDLLWYIAAVARYADTSLGFIATTDLQNLQRSTRAVSGDKPPGPSFDDRFPETERFPRQLQIRFREKSVEGHKTVSMTLLTASPNAFPGGPVSRGQDKYQGYKVGARLGNEVTDNSRRSDAYRYHDAIHLGFLAVLGWSPNLRALLQVKRKSEPLVDEADDGARAVFAEEGLAAVLAKQAITCGHFSSPDFVSDDLLDVLSAVVEDLEVGGLPYRMWRNAICQGFTVMRQLATEGGGYVWVDLDTRSLTYSKLPFAN